MTILSAIGTLWLGGVAIVVTVAFSDVHSRPSKIRNLKATPLAVCCGILLVAMIWPILGLWCGYDAIMLRFARRAK